MTVWDDVVGQPHVVAELSAAAADADALVTSGAAGARMTHAWLFTGPPARAARPPPAPSPPRSSA